MSCACACNGRQRRWSLRPGALIEKGFDDFFVARTQDGSGNALKYLQGLLLNNVRKRSNKVLQHFMTHSPWDERISKEEIADTARGRLKSKVDQLVQALNGKVTYHNRFLLRLHLSSIAFLAEQVHEIDQQIQKLMTPFQK